MRRSRAAPISKRPPILSEPWVEKVKKGVLSWSTVNGRDFPWRQTRDPYHLMVAEILLRRTQATRVVQPYLELANRFPDVASLASANPTELRVVFRPLGLAKKADQLIKAAQVIMTEHGGRLPRDLRALFELPGLGIYSARAVTCLAFGEPVPMVDESSGRLLRRIAGFPVDGPAYNDKRLIAFAERLLPSGRAREFNLGLLDLAAAHCRPRAPRCQGCPLVRLCSEARLARKAPKSYEAA